MCDNDSPFYQVASYTLSIEPYLNTYSKQYQNIITIDKITNSDSFKHFIRLFILLLSSNSKLSNLPSSIIILIFSLEISDKSR